MNGTSQKTLVQFHPDINHTGYQDILLAPRMDGLMAIKKDGSVIFWEFSAPHPETTFRTLYRVLFLSGLVLFAITFIINTVAELIRQRFRKRAMLL